MQKLHAINNYQGVGGYSEASHSHFSSSSSRANRTNGQRMTRGDIRHAVEVALKTWPEKTQQEIAEQVGCNVWLVNGVKQQLLANKKLDLPDTRMGRDGKERPTTYRTGANWKVYRYERGA